VSGRDPGGPFARGFPTGEIPLSHRNGVTPPRRWPWLAGSANTHCASSMGKQNVTLVCVHAVHHSR
jgi:hypothetical protein